MKLYIFRCLARRKLYGATRYETGSNLPRDKCSGGWEFYEQVELSGRGAARFRFDIDADSVRRQVSRYGWCVWDESPNDAVPTTPVERKPVSLREERPPAQLETIPSAMAWPALTDRIPPAAPDRRVSVPTTPGIQVPLSVATPAHHQVVWFDIPVHDLDRALRFYSAVLGLPLKKELAGLGVAIAVLPHADGSIGGCLLQNADARPSESGPLLYLNANGRLDESLQAVEQYGGKIIAARHSIAPFGFRAIVLDSEGNRVALHSS
jgi:uncharacterized protein